MRRERTTGLDLPLVFRAHLWGRGQIAVLQDVGWVKDVNRSFHVNDGRCCAGVCKVLSIKVSRHHPGSNKDLHVEFTPCLIGDIDDVNHTLDRSCHLAIRLQVQLFKALVDPTQ